MAGPLTRPSESLTTVAFAGSVFLTLCCFWFKTPHQFSLFFHARSWRILKRGIDGTHTQNARIDASEPRSAQFIRLTFDLLITG